MLSVIKLRNGKPIVMLSLVMLTSNKPKWHYADCFMLNVVILIVIILSAIVWLFYVLIIVTPMKQRI
jgi:hypothetical protein